VLFNQPFSFEEQRKRTHYDPRDTRLG